jgi:hypothetical protein
MDRRIISLLPSATEIVAALGLMEDLVGRCHECDYPREVAKLPICTEARLNPNKPSREIDADVQSLLQSALSRVCWKSKGENSQKLAWLKDKFFCYEFAWLSALII